MTKKKKKILVADDDEDVVFVLKEGLRDYDIITAYDGREAWEKIKENRPSLVIIDIIMPEINGADLNRKIKKDNEIKDIAVIIITGTYRNLRNTSRNSGANRTGQRVGLSRRAQRGVQLEL
jgi:CheY-like chemotaxis protein